MDEQSLKRIEQLLEEVQEVAEENNRILLNMQRQARWAFWGKLVLWLVVLVLPLLLLGPIIHAILPYDTTGTNTFFGLPSPEQIQQLMSAYKDAGLGGQ